MSQRKPTEPRWQRIRLVVIWDSERALELDLDLGLPSDEETDGKTDDLGLELDDMAREPKKTGKEKPANGDSEDFELELDLGSDTDESESDELELDLGLDDSGTETETGGGDLDLELDDSESGAEAGGDLDLELDLELDEPGAEASGGDLEPRNFIPGRSGTVI